MTSEKQRKPLGEMLKERGLVRNEHIDFAIKEQKVTKERIGEILERLCFVTEYDVIVALSEQEDIPYIDVDEVLVQENVLKLFNKNFCLTNIFLPLQIEDKTIKVAMASIPDAKLNQMITRQTGLSPEVFLCEKKKIVTAINKFYYFAENPVERLIEKEVNLLSHDVEMARGIDKLVDHILHLAVKMRATDVHLRPMDLSMNISFRIDGVMTSVLSLPVNMNRLISGLKMKAKMDIAEQRLPQDGRFSEIILNNGYDFRVSTVVSPQGENMVIRILPTENAIMGMGQLGFLDEHIAIVKKMFNEPFGIILLTGPTGSGKSTTLYAGIRSLNLLEENVITVEDPIEYDIPLLRQTQVNEKAGYTFANAIRYFLRHDPDVILVGEIRDSETASTAVTASSTGHLVLSTLHTNSSVGAIPRLRDLGVRSFLIADSLIGVVSQRLVRKICNACKEAYIPSDSEKAYLKDSSPYELYRGKGCAVCNGSGYFGRTLVYELLTVDKDLSRLIDQEAELGMILEKASQNGFVNMFDVTVQKVKEGITSAEEAIRVLGNIRQV
ncbi:MAG: GspE/PulE family protein [Desulfatiglans sp.]|jgi:general secretion pathway protein E/type IV pilus assembly protein PilB|nr:GspE/PulE family protein [Thermodesulfobacteriota bacterium]MEE4353867.1 GspE/PulE family protein [Desulfatiglans sp.]